jgi:ribosomal protein L36
MLGNLWQSMTMIGSTIVRRGMKVRTALDLRCPECYFARRRGVLYVNCRAHGRHKQRQGYARKKGKFS